MAITLSKSGIEQTQVINAWHVTQSIDAFSGLAAYNIILSGSYTLSGSMYVSGSISSSINNGVGFVGTASYALNAATSSYANNLTTPPTSITGEYVTSGSNSGTNDALKINAGYAEIPAGLTSISINFPSLNTKILGVDCFVSVGISSSYTSSTFNWYPRVDSLINGDLVFSTQVANAANNIPFFYTIIYK